LSKAEVFDLPSYFIRRQQRNAAKASLRSGLRAGNDRLDGVSFDDDRIYGTAKCLDVRWSTRTGRLNREAKNGDGFSKSVYNVENNLSIVLER
jgi:hypothetical protein